MRSGGPHVAEGVARARGIAQMRAYESPSAARRRGTKPSSPLRDARDACFAMARSSLGSPGSNECSSSAAIVCSTVACALAPVASGSQRRR
jgi:hypothetical protein